MATEDKKISSLTEWLYASVQDAANIVVAHAGANYRIAMQTLKQYVLGNREIGGPGSRDITTNGDAQILAQKRLDEPSFNDDVPLVWNVTATQMNFLSGLNVNVGQAINGINSNMGTIEDDVENLYSSVNALQADKIYSAGIPALAGETSIKIEASSMSSDDIDAHSLSISVYEKPSTYLMKLLNLSNVEISTTLNNILESITIADVVPGMSYQIVIRYRLAGVMGTG